MEKFSLFCEEIINVLNKMSGISLVLSALIAASIFQWKHKDLMFYVFIILIMFLIVVFFVVLLSTLKKMTPNLNGLKDFRASHFIFILMAWAVPIAFITSISIIAKSLTI